MYKFMMLSPQDVHVPTPNWKRTKTKRGSMKNIAPGTQGMLKYQKSLSEYYKFGLPGLVEKPLDPKAARRARRLKGHLEGVEDYDQNINRWDAAKAGNQEMSDIRVDMVRAGMGIKPKRKQKKVKEWLENMRASEYRFEAALEDKDKDNEKAQAAKRIVEATRRGQRWGRVAGTVGGYYLQSKLKPQFRHGYVPLATTAAGSLLGHGMGGFVGGALQGRQEKHKFNEDMDDVISYSIALGESILFEGVEATMAAVEKPAGRIRRAYNWAGRQAGGVKASVGRAAQWTGGKFSQAGGAIKGMANSVRARLVRKRAEDVIVPIQHS